MTDPITLPPLPESLGDVRAQQFRDYATAAVLADREAQGEPVAHMYPSDLEKFQTSETFATAFSVAVGNPDERSVPLYLAPQPVEKRKPLTEEQAVKLLIDLVPQAKADGPTAVFKLIVRAVEAAHGITGENA